MECIDCVNCEVFINFEEKASRHYCHKIDTDIPDESTAHIGIKCKYFEIDPKMYSRKTDAIAKEKEGEQTE